MKRNTSYVVAAAFSSVMLMASGMASGEETKEVSSDLSEEGWISDGASLGFPWWTKNPKKFEVLPEPLLYHLELSYSYSGSSGNIDLENHSGKGRLLLRKHTVTSETIFNKSSKETTKNIKRNAQSTLVEKQIFAQEFRLAVLENMALTAGLILVDPNSTKYIDQRMTYYGGLLYTPVNTPEFSLGMEVAYGYSETSSMNGDIPSYYKLQPVDDYDSDGIALGLKLNWNINSMITFSEEAKYQLFLEDTDYYSWNATTKLNFKLSKHISFFTEYVFDFEHNLFAEAVQDALAFDRAQGNPAGEMDDMDTTVSVGIKIEF